MHLVFLVGCFDASPKKRSLEQVFLENVMIREKGLYVLMGTKPLCCFDIEDIYSDNRIIHAYKWHLRDNYSPSPISFEEFQTQHKIALPQLPVRLRFETLWNNWCKTINSSVSPCYRFIDRKSPFAHEVNFGLFINIPSAIYVLKKNYEQFLQITGITFDPMTILDEISDNDSVFWEKVFHSHYLMGLLYGFGDRNSFIFDWGARYNGFLKDQQGKTRFDELVLDENKPNVTPADLKLPLFASFSIDDPTLEIYKREQKEIIKRFKGRDFMIVTLTWLQSKR